MKQRRNFSDSALICLTINEGRVQLRICNKKDVICEFFSYIYAKCMNKHLLFSMRNSIINILHLVVQKK